MILTQRQEVLFDFVKLKHGNQKRKYTDLPYHTHLLAVATLFSQYDFMFGGIEIALCHDILEDTDCYIDELEVFMLSAGYTKAEIEFISGGIIDLTNVYTSESYPTFNREKRKELEAERLSKIHFLSQSVKYCDLIDNTGSIVKYDPGFARKYLIEKERILDVMTAGNRKLYKLAVKTLQESKEALSMVAEEQ